MALTSARNLIIQYQVRAENKKNLTLTLTLTPCLTSRYCEYKCKLIVAITFPKRKDERASTASYYIIIYVDSRYRYKHLAESTRGFSSKGFYLDAVTATSAPAKLKAPIDVLRDK